METPTEHASAQIRRFMTMLFINRARRHLKTLADHYGWSPETLAAHENRFIQQSRCIPEWRTEEEVIRARLPEPEEEDDV